MWTFCVDYLCTTDKVAECDTKVAKIAGSKALQVFNSPDFIPGASLVMRRAQFSAVSDNTLIKKMRCFSKKLYTIKFVTYQGG